MKINKSIWLVIVLLASINIFAQENTSEKKIGIHLYVNPNVGKDDSDGTKDNPVKSLPEAAKPLRPGPDRLEVVVDALEPLLHQILGK